MTRTSLFLIISTIILTAGCTYSQSAHSPDDIIFEQIPYDAHDLVSPGRGRYYLDQIDLSNRAQPKVGVKINVPGILVGASETDPELLYFVDYRWLGDQAKDDLSVARVRGNVAYLQSFTTIEGWMGNVFVRGNKAYASVERYDELTKSDVLDGGAVLPGFAMPLAQLFDEPRRE